MRTALALVLLLAGVAAAWAIVEYGDPGSGFIRSGPEGAPGPGQAPGAPQAGLVLGDPATSGLRDWTPDFDGYPAKAFDFNGDGVKEVIVHGNDTKVYVFHGKTGRVLSTFTTTYPPGWYVQRVLNAVEAGVLVPGQPPSIVVANHAAYVSVWDYDPAKSSAEKFTFTERWEKRMDQHHRSPSMDAKPVLADLTRDGTLDIVVQTEEQGLFALRPDGTVLWSHSTSGGNSEPVVGDLDDDGKPEAVFASDGGVVTVLDGASGRYLWTFSTAQDSGVRPGSVPVAPTIADLDGSLPKEIVFTARDAHDRNNYTSNHVALFAVHRLAGEAPRALWMRQPTWANPLSYTHLLVEDVDGDGKPEVLGMDWNTIGHIPGDWERLGPAHVFALRGATGEDLWVHELDAWWSNKDIALLDYDGDGGLEVLANGPRDGYDGLWVLDAASGRAKAFLPSAPWKVVRGPAVADLYGKGLQLLLPVRPLDDADPRGAVLVFDVAKAKPQS